MGDEIVNFIIFATIFFVAISFLTSKLKYWQVRHTAGVGISKARAGLRTLKEVGEEAGKRTPKK